MKSKIVSISFAESAISDIEVILDYYREQQVGHISEQLVAEVVDAVERLIDFPEQGRIVPEFNIDHLRELIVPPFRIVYRNEPGRVRVVRVWRSERLMTPP